jgi:preprotein translocase subunit YajC
MGGLILLALLLVLFWFVLVRPQRTRAREQQELVRALEPGDEIVSTGGLYGTITEIEDEVLHVEIADGLRVRMARGAVAGIVDRDEETPGSEDESGYPEDAS